MTGEADWDWEIVHHWKIVRVADLPVPERLDNDEPPCTVRGRHVVGANPLARHLAQAFPRRGRRPSCCWYHHVDWHAVCSLANFLFAHWGQEWADRAWAAAQFLPEPERAALRWLGIGGLDLVVDSATGSLVDYNDGQHRALAMMRTGVPRVVVEIDP